MELIRTAHLNILESSTVSLSAGFEDPAHPLWRLHDRDVGRPFKAASAATLEVKVEQEAEPRAVDRLLIPTGHGLHGMTLDVMHSDDDAVYVPAVPQWTQIGPGLIDRSWSAITRRWWKFIVTSPSSAPEFPELFLTATSEWTRNPERPAGPLEDTANVESLETAGGQERFLLHGPGRRQCVYRVPRAPQTMKDQVESLNASWGQGKPFWLGDHEGTWLFGRLRSPLHLQEVDYRTYSFAFDFLEVRP
jgi:hypothetical protein